MQSPILRLFAHGRSIRLSVPADAPIDRYGTWEAMTRLLTPPPLDALDWSAVRRAAEAVDIAPTPWVLDVRVGPARERAAVTVWRGERLASRCQRCDGTLCHHVLGLLLAVLYDDAAWRPLLSRPPWQVMFTPGDRAAAGAGPGAAAAPDRHLGWLRVVLYASPGDAAAKLGGGRMSAWLMRASKQSGVVLKPMPLPRSVADAERRVRGLSPGELEFLAVHEEVSTLRRHGYDDGLARLLAPALVRIEADLFARLAGVRELLLGERPIAVDPTPWTPRLIVEDGPDGALALSWASLAEAIFPVGPGYVVVDGRLRPVAAGVAPDLVRWATAPPPAVQAGEVAAFVEQVVLPGPVEVEMRAAAMPIETRPPTPRLLLADDRGDLRVALRFGYGAVEAGADDGELLHDEFAEPPVWVRRDPAAEAAAWQRLAVAVDPLPATPQVLRFVGEAAFDFLAAAVGALDDFQMITDGSLDLRRWTPTGSLSAAGRLTAGIDWFDLEVDFEVEGRSASRAAVLASWRAGRRYVRLADGGVARLPEAWLRRHAAALEELDELRGRRHRVGTFAAPLLADVVDELGDAVAAARAHVERLQAMALRIRSFERVAERPVPAGVDAVLRPYQLRGFWWMRALAELGLSGVLADDMGLGKTVQTLVALLDTHRGDEAVAGPSLVVAPTSVVHNWVSEAARFTPGLRVALHHGSQRGTPPTDVDVVVTSYALLRYDADALHAITWQYVVLDEAQQIKNPTSQVARAARGLSARHRLALTGTPLENHLTELWSLFEFLMPGFFGSREAFGRRYVDPTGQTDDPDASAQAMAALRQRIRPFVLRRLKREVARELPPRQDQVLWCELSGPERRLYEAVKETYRQSVMTRVDEVGVERSTIQILEALTRLRQAACDASLLPFPEAATVGLSAKRSLLQETLAALIEEGHRTLVFSQWSSLLQRVRGDLDQMGVPCLYLDGSTRARADLQARWNAEDGPPVFLVSLKAGGTGLNLVGADVVIHLDPWWNPQAEQQATDRAHRIGQTRPVMVYRVVARDTVEEKVLALQARKRALFEAAVEGDRVTVEGLSRADLEAVFAADGAPSEPVAAAAAAPGARGRGRRRAQR
ncbi:MAG: helicase [Myxococcales bacterium]|nr:helicase [Myxococcales bacterium]MCB9542191.1 helicase [Myxococcales bacterium]MCB9553201.1 helicase [Myxococcales bacterium]